MSNLLQTVIPAAVTFLVGYQGALTGPARKFVRGPERTSGLRSCRVRVVLVPPAAAPSQLPAWDGCDPRQ